MLPADRRAAVLVSPSWFGTAAPIGCCRDSISNVGAAVLDYADRSFSASLQEALMDRQAAQMAGDSAMLLLPCSLRLAARQPAPG
jgi:hypothetical protein